MKNTFMIVFLYGLILNKNRFILYEDYIYEEEHYIRYETVMLMKEN